MSALKAVPDAPEATAPNFTLLVATDDLCQALAAIAPFANEDLPSWATVRLLSDEMNTYVAATSGSSMGLALVSTLSLTAADQYGLPLEQTVVDIDLTPLQCKAIVSLFKASQRKPEDGEEIGSEIRIEATASEVHVVDASGLFEGTSLTLPRVPTSEQRVAVLTSLARMAAQTPVQSSSHPPRWGKATLQLFTKVSATYGHPLVLEHDATRPMVDETRSGTTLVRCGESFIGLAVDTFSDDNDKALRGTWADGWQARLPRALDLHHTTSKEK